jgi:hypothetical protein
MKKFIKCILLFLAVAVLLTAGSCVVLYPGHPRPPHRVVVRSHVPPGHLKKMHGEKKAKAYAPGHQKKKR